MQKSHPQVQVRLSSQWSLVLQCSQKTPTKRTYRNHEYRSFCEHTRQLLKVTIRAVVVGPASHSGPFPADCTFCPAVWSPGEFRHGRWLCQDSLHTEKAEEGGGLHPQDGLPSLSLFIIFLEQKSQARARQLRRKVNFLSRKI